MVSVVRIEFLALIWASTLISGDIVLTTPMVLMRLLSQLAEGGAGAAHIVKYGTLDDAEAILGMHVDILQYPQRGALILFQGQLLQQRANSK